VFPGADKSGRTAARARARSFAFPGVAEMETAANCLIAPVTSRVIRMPSFGRIYGAPTLIRPATRQRPRTSPPPCFPRGPFGFFAPRTRAMGRLDVSTKSQFEKEKKREREKERASTTRQRNHTPGNFARAGIDKPGRARLNPAETARIPIY